MKPHAVLDDAARDRAALHALGALPPEEAALFRAHLGICLTCRLEVESLRKVASGLGSLPLEAEPPAGLRARLLERAGRKIAAVGEQPPASPDVEQIWKRWDGDPSAAAEIIVRAADATWESTGCPGVEVRRLFADPANERATLLIRMAPGSSYPAHRHGGAEECLVLQGEFLPAGARMRAGDYRRCAEGSVDGVSTTETGCLLLIVTSLRDELLPESRA